jgi:ABC-type lipoprotein export system ATPase subunit
MPADHVAASGAAGRGSPQPPRTLTIEVAREIAPLQLVLDRGLSYRALTDAMSRPRLLAALTTTPGIQVVPRDGGLLANLRVADNLLLPLRWLRNADTSGALIRAQRWMMELGIDPARCAALGDAMPEALTVFETRAVAWVRALLLNPEVLVLDRLSEGLVKRELLSASRVRSVFQRAYPFRTLLCVVEDAEAMEAGESFIDLRRMAAA